MYAWKELLPKTVLKNSTVPTLRSILGSRTLPVKRLERGAAYFIKQPFQFVQCIITETVIA